MDAVPDRLQERADCLMQTGRKMLVEWVNTSLPNLVAENEK